jgi:tetratricopeptide (TPR) repeat protein
LNPNSANAHYFYAMEFLISQNRLDQALAELRTAMSLDPLSPIVNTNYASTLTMAHHYEESLAQFQKALQGDPSFKPAHFKLSLLYAATGHFGEAVSELQKYSPTPGSFSPDANGYLALTLASSHPDEGVSPIAIAYGYAHDREKTLAYLEKAYAQADEELLLSLRQPVFDFVRSDPRYTDLMHRMGLPE